jgi:hypothetical protein
MEARAGEREGRQVKCLIASEGHLWMRRYFDNLPAPVRARLCENEFNICPACLQEGAQKLAHAHGLRRATTAIFMVALRSIERALRGEAKT